MTKYDLPEERRRSIRHILSERGKVTVPELSKQLGVSVDTIRRDLKDLEHAGQLTRVHGGALPCSPGASSFGERQTQNASAKNMLAKKTAELIQPGQVTLIDSGTTCLEIANNIPKELSATVITASPAVAIALGQHPHIHVIMLGGNLDKSTMTAMGSVTHDALSRIRADICILGVCSLHNELGITSFNYDEAEMKRMMIHNSSEVIAAVTADKIDTVAPFAVTGIDHITHIVTEDSISDEKLMPYKIAGISITKVRQ